MMPDTRPQGTLRIRLDVPSYQLQQHLPVEVRDSRLALVGTLQHGGTLSLAPGWYEVSAVLDDGKRHSETVRVTSGATEEVELRVDPKTLLATSTGMTRGASDIVLVGVEGASITERTSARWVFVPEGSRPDSMPVARLRVAGAELSLSLPVNPRGPSAEHSAAILTFERDRHGTDVRVSFHPERIVSTAILNMLDAGRFSHATDAAEQTADDMLRSKYQDPVGAALGAVILYRAGALGRRVDWLRNLARDFDWLPDGKILLALSTRTTDTKRATDLLLSASQQRPLFTESFSLLLDALRRWPTAHRADEITQALERVAGTAKRVDWGVFTLCTRES